MNLIPLKIPSNCKQAVENLNCCRQAADEDFRCYIYFRDYIQIIVDTDKTQIYLRNVNYIRD